MAMSVLNEVWLLKIEKSRSEERSVAPDEIRDWNNTWI